MMKQGLRLVAILGFLGLAACGGMQVPGAGNPVGTQPPISPDPRVLSGLEQRGPINMDGGLWSENRHRGLFNDLRARQVGDLVTVNIVETSKASKKATTKTGRESSINAGISNLLGYESRLSKIGVPGQFKNDTMLKASMKNDFSGSGETTRDETMTASITARVIQVLPNGNLVIKGVREIQVNNENQVITLTGIIRPEDISPDNTVLSSYIADARIAYSGRGPVTDKQKPGWLLRIVDSVWPF
ncbi:MAG: flagellar basal body L-ring protein FlgH [Deltaproteobacteria bacterium]|nr:flagellar basal body L-ring protein FlgH [Deltaproteobacteria bacterium]MBW2015438.1 flagellar basal body L-ring protein FlgH [Deltaproteobacteria bacterium]MBW2129192.1 flagellar basal body L-ring protein FlgH [Deltaproteobacteria bacterium]